MIGLGQRIKLAADQVGGLDHLAPLLTDISRRTLSDWANDKTEPRATSLVEIAKATDVSINWLMSGGTSTLDQNLDQFSKLEVVADQPGMVAIPRYDEVRPSAGFGTLIIDETVSTRVYVEQRWLSEIGASTDSTVILPATGDSMEPTIRNGAPMFVDTSKREVRNGYIYVFNVDGDLVVKRIERLLDGSFDLISDNKSYPTRNLSRATIMTMTVIGRVLASISTF